MATITGKDIVKIIANFTKMKHEPIKTVLNALEKTITTNLTAGNDVILTGIGTLRVVDTKERNGHNPKTGEAIIIKAGLRVKFMPTNGLRQAVKGRVSEE